MGKNTKSTRIETAVPAALVPAAVETAKPEILFTEAGKRGVATAYRKPGNPAVLISIKWSAKTKAPLHTDAFHVDLRSMKSENLQEALIKVVHATGHLALFEVSEYRGKHGMIRSFFNPKTENGYATLIRKGAKPFSFPLTRVDLAAMKSETLAEAFDKAVWATGSIAVVKYPDASPATTEAAVAQS